MRFLLPILAATLLLASVQATAGVILSLKTDALVNGPRIALGEVALLEADGNVNHTMTKGLTAIDLGNAPLPGYSARFTRKEIERLVRSSGLNEGITWRGAEAVRVERIAKAADPTQIIESAESSLRLTLRDAADRVELQLSEPLPDLQFPSGKLEFKPRPMTLDQALHRRVTVWVDVMIDGVFFRSVTVPFNVQAYRPVLVAKRDMPQGAVPQCDSLLVREEDVAALDSPPLPADCQAIQGHLKRSLALGAPLLKTHLQTPIAVAQGESVSLQMINGAIVLESRAVAMDNGEVGQRISVKPSVATETIVAEVIAPGVVKVTGR